MIEKSGQMCDRSGACWGVITVDVCNLTDGAAGFAIPDSPLPVEGIWSSPAPQVLRA